MFITENPMPSTVLPSKMSAEDEHCHIEHEIK